MNNETKTFIICRDGRVDLIATYTPIIKQKALNRLAEIGNRIDNFFVNH